MPVCSIPKWQSKKTIMTEKDRWIYLFKEGRNVDLDNPPETLNTEEMRQVMNVLHRFSENETNYLLYQSRLDAVLKENTYIHELEEARKEKELLQERLNNLLLFLKEKGINLDDV
jgi:hypothetical protein